ARAQNASTPPSSTNTSPGHGNSASNLSQKESFPSLAELMGNTMEVCPDVLSDPLKQFQELLDAKELQIRKVSIELAARLHQVQKILDTQPLEAHASLLSQRNSITAPLQSQLDLLDSEVAFLKESIARLAPPSIPNSVLPSRGGVVSAPQAPVVALDASNVLPDLNNPIHQALVRLGNFKSIPVFPSTGEVDFDRVNIPSFDKSPVLDLSMQLKGVKRGEFEAKFVESIFLFLNRFEKFFRNKLTDLFDFLSWKYMSMALTKVDQDQRFDDMIKMIKPSTARTWAQ
ncbi:hypothetical protein BG006_004484, partial [Podila minutissima]